MPDICLLDGKTLTIIAHSGESEIPDEMIVGSNAFDWVKGRHEETLRRAYRKCATKPVTIPILSTGSGPYRVHIRTTLRVAHFGDEITGFSSTSLILPESVKNLSPAELNVFDAAIQVGPSRKRIAEFLGKSPNTIKTHVRSIVKKLGDCQDDFKTIVYLLAKAHP